MQSSHWLAIGQIRTWGLSNVHEQTWKTPVGLGWENERFSFMAKSHVPFIVQAAQRDEALPRPAMRP
jgi:hypothetical protein